MSTKAARGGEVWIEYVDLDDLLARKRADNPKEHDGDLIGRLMTRAGYVDPVVIDERDGKLAAGHGRVDELAAMRAKGQEAPERIRVVRGKWLVPTLRGVRFKDEDVAVDYLIGANRSVERGGWENALLAKLIAPMDVDRLEGIGISEEERVSFVALARAAEHGTAGSDPDVVPDPPRVAVTRPGDLWVLGDHRLICGETTDAKVVRRALGTLGSAVLLHADPPYGMGKEAEGVANDNLRGERLDSFQMRWLGAWYEHFAACGSLYIWGNAPDLWRLWWRHMDGNDRLQLMVRNEVVWDKGSGFGMRSEAGHCFTPATERCLFMMRGQQFLGNQNLADYWEGYEPLRAWLEAERQKAGWTNTDVNQITGTQMAGHWFGKSQFMPISEEHYEKIRAAAEGRAFAETYDGLFQRLFPDAKQGGNAHRRSLSAKVRETRTFFDNTHEAMTDVWSFPRVVGDERFGHATPKPVAMVERALKSSSDVGNVVAVPFAGTGPEYVAGERVGRRVVGVEINPAYCDVVVERWEAFTGKKARRARS